MLRATMGNPIEEVLNDLGMGDGFRIPIANAENKRLEEEIERKTRLRASLKSQLDNARERIEDIRRHAADVRQQHVHNQRLLAAHSAQLEAEDRLYRSAQSEEARLGQETRDRERQGREADERIEALRQNAARLAKRLEASKRSIQMDRERLLAWEEKLNRKEERNIVIEQFVRSDEKTFKKIELERQMLSEKAEQYRQFIAKAVGDVNELELKLEKTGSLYAQAVKDRHQLMNQWTHSVHVLTQRDKTIYDALQEINELREIAKERMDAYQEAENFLAIQESENNELEDNTKQLEKELQIVKSDRQKILDMIEAYTLEVYFKKKQLQDVARRIQITRTNIKRKMKEVDDKRLKIEDCVKRIAELKETLKIIDGQKMNTEERMLQLQDMYEKEEKRKSTIMREIKRQQTLITRATARLNELEGERKVIVLRQQTETKTFEALVAAQAKDEKIARDRKERAYLADLELQKTEIRLEHLLGQEVDKEELESKQRRIKQLQSTLQERSETVKTLQGQVNQVENEIRKITHFISSNNEDLQRLKNKQQELSLLIEGGEKQLKVAQSNYEERKVEQSILELRVREAEKIALKVDDKLYDLEKYALQMEAAMQERRLDIKVQKDNFNLQRRIVLGECSELRSLIAERKGRTQQLQARYELSMAALGTNPEDGKPLTSAFLKIQSAQERYLLQERGDRLDHVIRKCEHEIQSMENTLRLVNVCNFKYKSSLSLVDESGPEKAEQRQLEEEYFNALEMIRQKRQAYERVQEDCKRMEENCDQLEKDIERINEERINKHRTVANLEQQITEQKGKICRADKNLRIVLKDIQNKCICTSDETILLQEKDIVVRDLQEQNTLALQRIAEFVIRHVEADVYVRKLLEGRNISLPSVYYLKPQQTTTPLSSSRCESLAGTGRTTKSTCSKALSLASGKESLIASSSVIQLEADFSGVESVRSSKSSAQIPKKRPAQRKHFT